MPVFSSHQVPPQETSPHAEIGLTDHVQVMYNKFQCFPGYKWRKGRCIGNIQFLRVLWYWLCSLRRFEGGMSGAALKFYSGNLGIKWKFQMCS